MGSRLCCGIHQTNAPAGGVIQRGLGRMKREVTRRIFASIVFAAGFLAACSVAQAANSFRMTAMFSDQAGLVQYIQFQELSGLDNQHRLKGLTLQAKSHSGVVKTFTFPHDLASSSTSGRPFLIGTTHTGVPDVDYMIPPGFLPVDGGTLVFAGSDMWEYDVLPSNGYTVLVRGTGPTTNTPLLPGFIFRPFTGSPTGLLVLMDPVIEYYNKDLDHYFMTSSQPDIDALDSGRIPDWERTGESFQAWIHRDPEKTPPNVGPVCRLYIPLDDGDSSHFFSASPEECALIKAQHPEYVLETSTAFYASLPDPQTGECLYNQTPVYRVWNGRADSNHRYTTSPAIRDQMVSQGFVKEGYGPDGVAMCVGNGPKLTIVTMP